MTSQKQKVVESTHDLDEQPGKRNTVEVSLPDIKVSGDTSILEEMRVRDKLNDEYSKAVKEQQTQAKSQKEMKMAKEVEGSMWGQLDTSMSYLTDTVTKV